MSTIPREQIRSGEEVEGNSNDLVQAVDKLLNEIGPQFSKVSTELFARMDDMAQRLDDMEAAIKAGNDGTTISN